MNYKEVLKKLNHTLKRMGIGQVRKPIGKVNARALRKRNEARAQKRERVRAWKQDNPTKVAAQVARWRKRNQKHYREYMRDLMRRRRAAKAMLGAVC